MVYEIRFLWALLLTVAVEGTVVTGGMLLLPDIRKTRPSLLLYFYSAVFPSVATLPYLWFILPLLLRSFMPRFLIGEIAVALVETVMLHCILRTRWRNAALLSVAANGASIIAGFLLFR